MRCRIAQKNVIILYKILHIHSQCPKNLQEKQYLSPLEIKRKYQKYYILTKVVNQFKSLSCKTSLVQ